MDLTLGAFLEQVAIYPSLAVIVLLVIGVTVISGATDAPNAIATAVSTRCMTPGSALVVAAVFNLVGIVGMTYISTAVAHTMFSMVNFQGDTHTALLALEAAMIGSIVWGIICWFLGIPASKSHSLIAGITGGAIALNGVGGVVVSEWMKVVYGMAFSLIAGFVLGWVAVRLVEGLCSSLNRRRADKAFTITQNINAALLSFLHGAQDGQKFMSIGLLGIALASGTDSFEGTGFPLWLMVVCSLAISLGTFLGGKRIIKSVAMDMVSLEKHQGASATSGTIITLFVSSITGMPVSTSHASTAAIMGVGASANPRNVKWGIARHMVYAWLLTFPCCGLIGYVLAKLFMML
ncbi:inorganic phosphate transporter [Eggerthellaceae bacterium zg-1084]|uniref:Inorganic phosphate transporter n=1 Tax=Berryella wangjianweii TaxID=2734634 RepID=A0A6M8J727_9ACTN|nr:inorganic phosphate transporter [Berryella wangjianweii]NPD31189.1 inorganic phosphate transporter [Berryella wangjianweii]NPD32502.1 inorganic phosphate transporter [Eggerthellaceae bacterium zg-997]QKF06742.1 inorganic phosphate transporter [Berryella wangjianweii]